MTGIPFSVFVIIAVVLAVFGGRAISAQDKYTVQVPNGLVVQGIRRLAGRCRSPVRRLDRGDRCQSGNDRSLSGRRPSRRWQTFPGRLQDGEDSLECKEEWEAPAPTTVPDTLHDVDFMVRDSKRFPDTGAWGYAQFNYDAPSDTFAPEGTGVDCGFACHTIVAAKDYVFTAYPKR